MDWTQVVSVFAVVATNLITVITLYVHQDKKTEDTINAIREENRSFQKAILDEMKDFHGRLCAIEERYRSREEKLWTGRNL